MDMLMEKEMKEKITKEYKRRLRLVWRSKLNGRNKIQGINTWAVAMVRYGGGILDWKSDELKKMDRQTRKTMTMYGALHPKSDVDRLYLPRKVGGRGLISCENCVRAEQNNIGWYIKNTVEPLLMAVRKVAGTVSEQSVKKDQYKKKEMAETEERWREKIMYGQYVREFDEDVDIEMTWKWMRKSDLKPETEALICAAQEQALRTNYVKCRIDKTAESQ